MKWAAAVFFAVLLVCPVSFASAEPSSSRDYCAVSLWARTSAPSKSVSLDAFAAAVAAHLRGGGAEGATAAWAGMPSSSADLGALSEVVFRVPSGPDFHAGGDSELHCRARLGSLAARVAGGRPALEGGGPRLGTRGAA